MTTETLTAEEIGANLGTVVVGRRIVCLESVTSTNDWARAAAEQGEPEGTVVVAERQTSGRGQRGRLWISPAGECILASVIFRPDLAPSDLFALTMLAAVAAAAAVDSVLLPDDKSPSSAVLPTRPRCRLKWPNDVTIAGRKVAGILTEAAILEGAIESAVVGIGINVGLDPRAYPGIAATATSLAHEIGHPIYRLPLLRELLRELDRRYSALARGQSQALFEEWRERLSGLGQTVTLINQDGEQEAVVAEDVATDGALVYRGQDGIRRRALIGEVSLRQ